METYLKTARLIAHLMDTRFKFLGFKFGLSGIFDLIPGFGDIGDALLAFSLVFIGMRMGLPEQEIGRMIFNIVLSFVIGLIPILGDAVYLFYKPNLRNLRILEEFAKGKNAAITGQVIK